jgi:hypothetical protein
MDQELTDTEKSTPNFSDAIDQIMAHPEWITMVASALGKPPAEKESPKESEADKATVPSDPVDTAAAALTPMLSKLSQMKAPPSGGKSTRAELLCALKPYLSPGRQEAIDYMIRISQISDLLKHLT